MNRALILIMITLLSYAEVNSQDIKTSLLNEDCKCKATLLDSLLTQVKNLDDHAIDNYDPKDNKISVEERISFLNDDFDTNSFSKGCEVKCVDFITDSGLHLGIIDIGIRPKDKKKCIEAIKLSHRENFNTKVLTKFKVIEKDHELVLIYSESSNHPAIKKLLSK